MFPLSTLSIRLRRITLLAQHLQVVIRGMSTFAPRNDMVTFHVLIGILGVDTICNAQGTLMPLPLVGTEFLRLSKRTKGQVLLITPSAAERMNGMMPAFLVTSSSSTSFLMSASRALPTCLVFHDFLIGVEVPKKSSDVFFCVALTCLVRDLQQVQTVVNAILYFH